MPKLRRTAKMPYRGGNHDKIDGSGPGRGVIYAIRGEVIDVGPKTAAALLGSFPGDWEEVADETSTGPGTPDDDDGGEGEGDGEDTEPEPAELKRKRAKKKKAKKK